MRMMEYSFIQTKIEQHIFSLTLNRPEKHNALNIDLVKELNHCFNELKLNSDLHAVFIFGNEKAFSAGGDLKEMKSLAKEEAEERSAFVQETFQLLNEISVPVVSFIQGICFGGGLELALHTDFSICDDKTRLALPEIRYGMIPGAGGTVQLPIQMGMADAAYYLLTGNELPLSKALNCGIVQKIVAEEDFSKELRMQSDYFSSTSREALSAIKSRLQTSKSKSRSENYQQESELFAQLLAEQGHSGIEKNFIKKK